MNPVRSVAPHRLASVLWRGEWRDGAEIAADATAVAGGLVALGVAPGDSVAILMRNCLEMLVAQRAIAETGAYAVPVNWHGTIDDQRYVLDNSHARVVITHAGLWAEHAGHDAGTRTIVAVPDESGAHHPDAVEWDALRRNAPLTQDPGHPVESIIYTSGTTGRPKGVKRDRPTDAQAAWASAARTRLYGMRPGARVLITAPLYHAAPSQLAAFSLTHAEAIVLTDRFDPVDFLRVVESERITHVFAVPTMFSRILLLDPRERRRYDTSSLEFVLHAGAPCPSALKARAIEEWGPVLYEYYGSTELGPVTFCDSEEWLRFPGTVGRPLEGVELVCIDEATGLPSSDRRGEIAVRNPLYADFTYTGAPEQRAELQRGEYVATGDVGHLNDEGYLFISDRVRDVIISGGVNLYPAEIESVVMEIPGVVDCAVFAIPDEDLGETVGLIIEPSPSAGLDEETIRAFLATRMGRLKVPRLVEFRTVLPREENGKIKKRLLRAAYWPVS